MIVATNYVGIVIDWDPHIVGKMEKYRVWVISRRELGKLNKGIFEIPVLRLCRKLHKINHWQLA